ncbi:hypothetical protein M408DRAFT_330358 [Serendipita vermifera MAFF 305830]|uniref:Exonuclease domain-containing protein n=1 Tax=Serendipita vermifera MAFF 305830 TaxID=933852 RepID=A0A0C3B487_SERVB|nr:hypothetical protein M408DRAFT_330358 [Serendipita vermifera MAFF 305830]
MSGNTTFMAQTHPLTAEDGPLVWIDCEMTGLDFKKDVLLEVAVIITNGDLKKVHEGISHVIRTDKSVLDRMDKWCTKTHGETGLTAACIASPHSHEWVESSVLEYIKRWVPEKRTGVLAGSSVHADRYIPCRIHAFSCRLASLPVSVDVSSVKELRRRWFPTIERKPEEYSQGIRHRALDDIEASIEELRWYRDNIFIKPPSVEK